MWYYRSVGDNPISTISWVRQVDLETIDSGEFGVWTAGFLRIFRWSGSAGISAQR